ncbi:MAG: hypothetical protein F4Y88_02255 [Chloroflexi bacterium]|nr:hypothetical protein [Chloroflexota bacterium]
MSTLEIADPLVRKRLFIFAVVAGTILVPNYALAWVFDVYDDTAHQIAIPVLGTVSLLLVVFSLRPRFACTIYVAMYMLGAIIGFFTAYDDFQDWPYLSADALVLVWTLPSFFAISLWVRGNWHLITSLLLALIATTVFWTAAFVRHEIPLDTAVLPFFVLLAGVLLWLPLADWSWESARLVKHRRFSGPGMQAFAMVILFLPVTIVAIAVPTILKLDEIWVASSLMIISVLISAVIAGPLRQLLVEWGDLNPNRGYKNSKDSPIRRNPYV